MAASALERGMDKSLQIAEARLPLDPNQEDRAQFIRDSLRDAIVDRRLAPGTKLSEAEVGTLFDVSRTVVRAALQMLAFEGLVKVERNRGAFVSDPTPEEALQVFASRRLIEPGIIAAVIERVTAADIAAFRARQTAAFEAEKQRWHLAGEFDRHDEPAEVAVPEVTLPAGAVAVTAPFAATVWRLVGEPGTLVGQGDPVLTVETMKMEAKVTAPVSGRLVELYVSLGDQVVPGQILAAVRP